MNINSKWKRHPQKKPELMQCVGNMSGSQFIEQECLMKRGFGNWFRTKWRWLLKKCGCDLPAPYLWKFGINRKRIRYYWAAVLKAAFIFFLLLSFSYPIFILILSLFLFFSLFFVLRFHHFAYSPSRFFTDAFHPAQILFACIKNVVQRTEFV